MPDVAHYSLTYDDGPMEWTEGILDHLEEYGQTATFFMLGHWVAGREHTLVRAVELGCEIAMHGWSHRPMLTLTDDEIRTELHLTAAEFRRVLGEDYAIPAMRCPYHNGARDPRVRGVIESEGYTIYMTNNDPGDYGDTQDRIFDYVTGKLKAGHVVNLHDGMPPPPIVGAGWNHRENTVAATRRILEWATERGLRSVTATELGISDPR